jgi:hypothetical protein
LEEIVMAAIQYPGRGTTVHVGPAGWALTDAVLAALGAPSILNTQPWQWRIDGDTAQLRADRSRQLPGIDPDGRLLTLSCGAALHHVRVALAADGVAAEVTYLPDAGDPELLAAVRYTGPAQRSPASQRLRRAMGIRRTDRRPFADQEVPEAALEQLRRAALDAGGDPRTGLRTDLRTVRREDLGDVRAAVEGVTGSGPRPAPVRGLTGEAAGRGAPAGGEAADRHARFAVVVTAGDLPPDWIAAGEALSAVLLTAAGAGLATAPMSDLVEVQPARAMLRRMLGDAGHPAVVVRVGVPGRAAPPPAAR